MSDPGDLPEPVAWVGCLDTITRYTGSRAEADALAAEGYGVAGLYSLAAVEQLAGERDEARSALAPFARFMDEVSPRMMTHFVVDKLSLTAGEIRAAARAIKTPGKP
jgi:hypothetical protein